MAQSETDPQQTDVVQPEDVQTSDAPNLTEAVPDHEVTPLQDNMGFSWGKLQAYAQNPGLAVQALTKQAQYGIEDATNQQLYNAAKASVNAGVPPSDQREPTQDEIEQFRNQSDQAMATAAGSMGTISKVLPSAAVTLASKGISEAAPVMEKLKALEGTGGGSVLVKPSVTDIAADKAIAKGLAKRPETTPYNAAEPTGRNTEDVLTPEQSKAAAERRRLRFADGGEAPVNSNDVVPDDQVITEEEQFTTPGQQVAAGLEGVAQGIVGPLAPMTERALGVSPEDIRRRAEYNPATQGLGEAAGFTGSLLASAGLGKVAGMAGEAAVSAARLGEAATPVAKIAATGVRTGAEMAALQTSDELSNMINKDPNQSLGSAAINIGLSGLLGGVSGVVLGSVSPLWRASVDKLGIPDLIDNAKAQYDFRVKNPDLQMGAVGELSQRMQEMQNLRDEMGTLKSDSLTKVIPEDNSLYTPKINKQINDVIETFESKLDKAAESVKTRSAVPFLSEDFDNFQNAVYSPNATNLDKFNALNKLKQTLDTYQKFTESVESTSRGQIAQDLQRMIRPALEDSKVWGKAGDVQRDINKTITQSIKSENDLLSKFTSKQLGITTVDPAKVQTYIRQASASKAGLKTSILKNYLDATQDLADTVGQIHTDAGLGKPLVTNLNPTAVLNHTMNAPNAGTHLGDWLFDQGLASAAGNLGAEAAGAGLGAVVGHPYLGASVGQYVLGPLFKSIAKPLLEKASNAGALKAGVDFVQNVARGQKFLTQSTANFFKGTAESIPRSLIPDAASRDKLEQSLDYLGKSPQNNFTTGGNLSHYFPEHQTALASLSATAQTYLNSLKPVQQQKMPLDSKPPVNKIAKMTYERQLDIAQQPLLVLKYAKEGTLTPLDVRTLNTLYPSLHAKIVDSLTQNMIKTTAEGYVIPYAKRQTLSLLLGTPLDSTQTQASMQAIIRSVRPTVSQPQSGKAAKQSKTTNAAISQTNKVNAIYSTPLQAREAMKRE